MGLAAIDTTEDFFSQIAPNPGPPKEQEFYQPFFDGLSIGQFLDSRCQKPLLWFLASKL